MRLGAGPVELVQGEVADACHPVGLVVAEAGADRAVLVDVLLACGAGAS